MLVVGRRVQLPHGPDDAGRQRGPGSIYHSHSFDAQATRIADWKIVMPSNPLDAYGLMLSAIVDLNPVMFLPPKALLRKASVPQVECGVDVARELARHEA